MPFEIGDDECASDLTDAEKDQLGGYGGRPNTPIDKEILRRHLLEHQEIIAYALKALA